MQVALTASGLVCGVESAYQDYEHLGGMMQGMGVHTGRKPTPDRKEHPRQPGAVVHSTPSTNRQQPNEQWGLVAAISGRTPSIVQVFLRAVHTTMHALCSVSGDRVVPQKMPNCQA